MSSLTDIIFLLLIFFMLTSNFVKIQPFELPESDSKTVAPTSAVVTPPQADRTEAPRATPHRRPCAKPHRLVAVMHAMSGGQTQ